MLETTSMSSRFSSIGSAARSNHPTPLARLANFHEPDEHESSVTSNCNPAVLFVGARRGALEACSRLGIPAAVLYDGELPRALRRLAAYAARVDLGDRECVEEAAVALEAFAPTCVMAVAERSVVPAAWLRASLGVPGSDSEVAWRCHDKLLMKRALARDGIAVTQWLGVDEHSDAGQLIEQLGSPLVVKPRTSSGSRGLTISGDRDVVRAALRRGYIAERFVHGVEMSIESFRAHGRTLFVNPTTYHEPLWANLLPADLPTDLRDELYALNERVLSALGVRRGMAHLEVFLTDRGPVVGEVAIRPPGGYLMRLLALAYGFDPWEALLRILVFGDRPDLPRDASGCAAVRIFHPGAGKVRRITGADVVRAWPETVEFEMRVRAGTRIATREGSGQEAGHLILHGADRDRLAARLDEARRVVRVELEDEEGRSATP